ncbi:protein artichoke [Schistocerca cancellata]|uniref:protein artichoke n=1 Tax=Schistocerca cancellata TaxID=274614 RepID=UPI00211929CB|nr:protein artichoke [Schistocerca cancellata]
MPSAGKQPQWWRATPTTNVSLLSIAHPRRASPGCGLQPTPTISDLLREVTFVFDYSGQARRRPSVNWSIENSNEQYNGSNHLPCSHSDVSGVVRALQAAARQLRSRAVDELVLEGNALPALPGRAFAPLRVLRLMLRDNGLERVAPTWLGGLEDSLLELFLVEPALRSLPADSLLRMRSLEALTVQAGGVRRVPQLSGLPRLHYVSLECPALEQLQVSGLPALSELQVSGAPRLSRLEERSLGALPRLHTLNVTACGLRWLHARSLAGAPALRRLLLADNRLQDAALVGRAARALPALDTLVLDRNLFDRLGEATFVELPSLRELRLADNRIEEVQRGAFHRVPALRVLDLSRNLLRRIHPEAFLQGSGKAGVEELYLEGNQLSSASELRSALSQLPRLRFLDASGNRVSELEGGALHGHGALEQLHLERNGLRRLHRGALRALPALRELRLRNNSLAGAVDAPFWDLPALKGLDLSFNFFPRLDERLLANLPALRRLDVSGNMIADVDPTCFLDTPQLESVNLSGNALVHIHPVTFRNLNMLFEVDMARNRLLELPAQLPQGLEHLHAASNQLSSMPALALPALRSLDLTANALSGMPDMRRLPHLRKLHLGQNLLQHLRGTDLDALASLEELDLHDNRLVSVESLGGAARQLRSLQLRGNRLQHVPAAMLRGARLLRHCDLSRNHIAAVDEDALADTRDLETLDMSHNVLEELPEAVARLPSLRALDASHNRLVALPAQGLTAAGLPALTELSLARNRLTLLRTGAFSGLPRLSLLDLENNWLESVETGALSDLPQLRAVRLAHNRLQQLPRAAMADLPQLRSAELQENSLSDIADEAIYGAPHLLLLNLSHNALTGLERAGIKGLKSLEVLDLSNNQLSHIPGGSLTGMDWLVELKMDNNRICAIQGSPFNEMPRLRFLSLRNNKMTSFPEPTFKKLRSNFAVLDIAGNPISCTCNSLWLQNWMREAPGSDLYCSDGSLLKDARLSRQECKGEQITEKFAPGCDSELTAGNSVQGTSQVLSTWVENSPTQEPHPLPQDSGYFYDDFVEYQYEDMNNTENNASLSATSTNINTLTPGFTNQDDSLSSHYISGDTPTFYAGTQNKRNKTSTDDIVPIKIPQHVPPSTSGITFFGIPLPSLSLGGLWGSSRKADSGPAEVRFVGARGKVHIPPPTAPQIQNGGFIPMLPESGGFTPIANPQLKQEMREILPSIHLKTNNTTINLTSQQVPNNTLISQRNISVTSHMEKKITLPQTQEDKKFISQKQMLPADDNEMKKVTEFKSGENINPELPLKPDFMDPLTIISNFPLTKGLLSSKSEFSEKDSQLVTYTHVNTSLPNQRHITLSSNTSDNHALLSKEVNYSQQVLQQTSVPSHFGTPSNIQKKSQHSSIKQHDLMADNNQTAVVLNMAKFLTETFATGHYNNTSQTTTSTPGSTTTRNTLQPLQGGLSIAADTSEDTVKILQAPSSLSSLLIPQEPSRPPTGKSTITKVLTPPQLSPGPEPVEDYLRGPEPNTNPRSAEDPPAVRPPAETVWRHNSSIDWYFRNYNNTELEPYVGHGRRRMTNQQPRVKTSILVLILMTVHIM